MRIRLSSCGRHTPAPLPTAGHTRCRRDKVLASGLSSFDSNETRCLVLGPICKPLKSSPGPTRISGGRNNFPIRDRAESLRSETSNGRTSIWRFAKELADSPGAGRWRCSWPSGAFLATASGGRTTRSPKSWNGPTRTTEGRDAGRASFPARFTTHHGRRGARSIWLFDAVAAACGRVRPCQNF